MAQFSSLNRLIFQRLRTPIQRRLVSTSKKNNDTIAANECITKTSDKLQEKNWISYGYEYENKVDDRRAMHSVMFAGITLCMVVVGFVWSYAPDYNLRDWAVREAFLELRRREAAGLPLVDPNFIPPENILLPSDEELGDTEIII
ncbi:NADH dehydrogenase [ubiquinone] 1 beta subcomplex subunit 11, mitochondrial [Euwallacea fornicatus]|uniref:NADH dehydrogenase [ubiquinone] 1 beta subcomplex subunit 11, mitochondrial n=1 Tax=Euwallacea fornicatus TaxID=995702 RepID=UPI00338FF82A